MCAGHPDSGHALLWGRPASDMGKFSLAFQCYQDCLHLKTPGTQRNGLSSAPGTSCFMSEHLYIRKNEHLPSSKRKRNATTTDHKAGSDGSFSGSMIIEGYSKLPEARVLAGFTVRHSG